MIEAKNVVKKYDTRAGEVRVLDGVTLRVEPGRAAVVMGPSGSGKSTLLHILGTLDTPTSGEVLLNGGNPFALAERERADFRNRHIGFVFQDHQLLPQCTVLENVLLPSLARRLSREEAENRAARAEDLLRTVGLSHRISYLPPELSGGEKQRVAIARALLLKPSILLCDEPTGNLDQVSGGAVADCLAGLLGDGGPCMVLVTHNRTFADRFGRVLALEGGTLRE